MATREENLKKINEELELMSDEELDKVAGGSPGQTADDSRFFNSLNGSTNRYDAYDVYHWDKGEDEVEAAWSKVGITAELYDEIGVNNKYFLNGNQITQEQARQHAMNVVGKQMKESEWKW